MNVRLGAFDICIRLIERLHISNWYTFARKKKEIQQVKTKVYKRPSHYCLTPHPLTMKNLETALLVDVAITFALLADLEETRDAEDKDGVDAWESQC